MNARFCMSNFDEKNENKDIDIIVSTISEPNINSEFPNVFIPRWTTNDRIRKARIENNNGCK